MKLSATDLKMVHVCMFLSLILGMTAAVPQDMSGKMLVFPQETSTAHVRLTTSIQTLGALTVCLRYFTDLTRGTTLFSLATPSYPNDFFIFKTTSSEINVYVRNVGSTFKGQGFQINRWQSICATWDAGSGLAQLWLDGKPSSLKFITNSKISGSVVIVLGQDQDAYGGGFVSTESFMGMMTDVHMWDYVLSPCYIEHFHQNVNSPEGSVLNWKSLDFQISGKVLVQNEQHSCKNGICTCNWYGMV